MKRLILAAMTVAAMTVASTAQAALAYSLVICQTNTCTTYTQNLVNGVGVLADTIGDYNVTGVIAGGIEGTPTSNSATGTFQVTRTAGTTNTDPLSIWLSVTNYTQPTGATYDFDVTMGTTQTSTGSTASRGLVTYQAWYSLTNGTFTGAPRQGQG